MPEVNRGVFLLVLFFFLLTPAGNPPRLISAKEREILHRYIDVEDYQLAVVVNQTDVLPGSLDNLPYGNLTGFRHGYPIKDEAIYKGSIIPKAVNENAVNVWTSEDPAFQDFDPEKPLAYVQNISATMQGKWHTLKDVHLVPVEMPLMRLLPEPSDAENSTTTKNNQFDQELISITHTVGNVTGSEGNIHVSIYEHANKTHDYNVTMLTMELTLSDTNHDHKDTLQLRGVHIQSTGNILLTSQSLKYSGYYALPHFLPEVGNITSVQLYNETRMEMIRFLNETIELHKEDMYFGLYEQAVESAAQCEYIVYGHVHSSGLTKQELRDAESELENPQGRPHKRLGNLEVSLVLYSPDCAVALGCDDLQGEKFVSYYTRMREAIMAGLALLLLQTVFMALQMKDTSTPSTISKVSFYSIGLMALLDGSICMVSLFSSFLEDVALPFMAVAFVSFSLTSLFEMRYMVLIYRSQLLESVADERARQATVNGETTFVGRPDGTLATVNTSSSENGVQNAPQSSTNAGDSDGLPFTNDPNANSNTNNASRAAALAAATAPAPSPSPVDMDEHQVMGLVYSRLYFSLIAFLLLTIVSTSWPLPFRRGYEYLCCVIIYSLWVPQIYRNVMRGTKKSLLFKFVAGCSVIRVVPAMYLCLYKNNVLKHHYDPNLFVGICMWVWIQVMVLVCQNIFGPRFFLPRGVLTTLYDYHPIITEDDLEGGFNISKDTSPLSAADADVAGSKKPGTADNSDSNSESEPLMHNSHVQVDCAICMTPVDLVLVAKDRVQFEKTNPASILARRKYMVTPCRHVYHTECMEHWLRTRLQCPICRNPLPPI